MGPLFEISSNALKCLLIVFIGCLLLGCLGCATRVSGPQSRSPRTLASLQLTEQGRIFLESDDPDNAIRTFERAMNLNPTNGQNYYYMAEAWLLKGVIGQAKEFNRLAEIRLKNDPAWLRLILEQRERIKERSI